MFPGQQARRLFTRTRLGRRSRGMSGKFHCRSWRRTHHAAFSLTDVGPELDEQAT